MGKLQWFNDNFFLYGETNNRLNGIRSSEVYKLSADKIENYYIAETGALQSAKQWELQQYQERIYGNAKIVFDTPRGYYIVITDFYLQTRKDSDDTVIDEVNLGNGLWRASYFNDIVLLSDGTSTMQSYSLDVLGYISGNTFLDTIQFPLEDRYPFEFDIYKCYNDGSGGYKSVLMATFSEQELKVDNTGAIFLGDEQIVRVYTVDSQDPQFFMDASSVGDLFMIIKNFETMTLNRNIYIDNDELEIAFDAEFDPTYDAPFAEYAKVNGVIPTVDVIGTVRSGNIDEFTTSGVVATRVFQNRLFMITDDKIYASGVFDYNNFLNGTESSDAFYIKPSPPNQQQPLLYNLVAGNGLYISSNEGIYVFGYDTILTPSSSLGALRIASDEPIRYDSDLTLIRNDLYYFTEDNILKCIQPTYNTGQLTFWNSTVEKFDNFFNSVEGSGTVLEKSCAKIKLNNQERLIVGFSISGGADKFYIYDRMDYNVFRRYTLDTPEDIYIVNTLTIKDRLIIGGTKTGATYLSTSIYKLSNLNYETLTLKVHTPDLKTSLGGSYLNDYYSQLKKIAINILNENTDAIEAVKVNGRDINLLTTTDLFSLYKADVSYKMYDGIEIEITTKENSNLIEIKGVDMLIDINGDR